LSHPTDELTGKKPALQSIDPNLDAQGVDPPASDAWWNPDGDFRSLHLLNPVRLAFIRSRLLNNFHREQELMQPFTGLRLLDIGCGGGLVAEPMTRLGFKVTGIDVDAEAIAAARVHARAAGLDIDYRIATAGLIADAGERFDVVLALEVIEHVADRDLFLRLQSGLVAPNGAFIAATINRTARSFALAIVGAEYILGWIPRGTHTWRKFVRPSELILGLRHNGLDPTEIVGFAYDFGAGNWVLSRDTQVNYLVMAVRPTRPNNYPSVGGIQGI
jgi:2-polyprenyl-6-hydroxyphenyl methylase / 3-demethylubiquinone-9 3-methyltransferase